MTGTLVTGMVLMMMMMIWALGCSNTNGYIAPIWYGIIQRFKSGQRSQERIQLAGFGCVCVGGGVHADFQITY